MDVRGKTIWRGKTNDQQESVLACLQQAGVFMSAPCGGKGTCGKCRIRFLSALPEPTEADLAHLDEEQLKAGWRLACQAHPDGEFSVELSGTEENILASASVMTQTGGAGEDDRGSGSHAVAVDLGTTTIAAALLDTRTGAILDTRTGTNHQRAFGADVISRIKAAGEGNASLLQRAAVSDVHMLIRELGEDPDTIPVVISGNTTMQHLYQGLPCESLGVAPYTPVDISLRTEGNVTYMPGISTYVGADIVSGICECGLDLSDEVCLFLDLGTNGELAIGRRDRLLVASTAAGPALEGGNISCGVAGIPGAVSRVSIGNGRIQCETIGGAEPAGLCGSGVLETVYELLNAGYIEETGRFCEEYPDGITLCGTVRFTQQDVREVQLAKAAIRAGAETLIEAYGITYDDIAHVYLAGGFGQQIDLVKAAGIGLIPPELVSGTEAVGNTSLAGAARFCTDSGFRDRVVRAAAMAEELPLTGNPVFSSYYVDYMIFEEE